MSTEPCKIPRMIVVDDDQDMAGFVRQVGQRMGFDCVSAQDFNQFLEAHSDQTDFIVLDIFMPNMDGIEFIRHLASKKCTAQILLMSGNDRTILNSARKIAVELGLNVMGALSKPFRIADFEGLFETYRPLKTQGQARTGTTAAISAEDLADAIGNKELSLHFQPQVSFASGEWIGVEALCRWNRPGHGAVPTVEFISLAEETGLILPLTDEVIDMALAQLTEWDRDGFHPRMSINLSPGAMLDVAFPEHLMAKLAERDLPPERIVLEVTETMVSDNSTRMMDILTRLRMKGITLAIDDFGTGFSSLQQIVRAPFKELKIDMSFVQEMANDRESRAVVRAAIGLAHELGMEVVAEGVEDARTAAFLRELKCDIGQGYHFGRPMDAETLVSLIGETAHGREPAGAPIQQRPYRVVPSDLRSVAEF